MINTTLPAVLSPAAIANCEECAPLSWREGCANDVKYLREGRWDAATLLENLLDGVDDAARQQGWVDYVRAVADVAGVARPTDEQVSALCRLHVGLPDVEAVSPLQAPVVNMNGSSKNNLMDQLHAVALVGRELLAAMADAAPHGRDYQTLPAGAWATARSQHDSRAQRLSDILDEVNALALALSDQGR